MKKLSTVETKVRFKEQGVKPGLIKDMNNEVVKYKEYWIVLSWGQLKPWSCSIPWLSGSKSWGSKVAKVG